MSALTTIDWLIFEIASGDDVITEKQLDAVLSLYDIELEKLASTVAATELQDQVYEGISYDDLWAVISDAHEVLNNFHGWLFDRHASYVDTWGELEGILNMLDYTNNHPKWDFYSSCVEVSKNILGDIIVITKDGKIKVGRVS